MNEIQEKIVELRQKQKDEDSSVDQDERVFDLTEIETLKLNNFALQRQVLELQLRELDARVAGWNRALYDRLEVDPKEYEIGFDDNVPGRIFARKKKIGAKDVEG